MRWFVVPFVVFTFFVEDINILIQLGCINLIKCVKAFIMLQQFSIWNKCCCFYS